MDKTRPASGLALHVLGALTACLGALPAAALVALVYGFPVPFAGKLQGPADMSKAATAVLFYGVLGGFLVLALAGVIASAIALRVANGSRARARRPTILFALAASLLSAVGLAVLDLFIGQW